MACNFSSVVFGIMFVLLFNFVVICSGNGGLMHLSDEWLQGKVEQESGPHSSWNISGRYRGNWEFLDAGNGSSNSYALSKSSGIGLKLISTLTKTNGVHYVQGHIILHDMFDDERDAGVVQMRVQGVYLWSFRQLRLVTSSGKEGMSQQDDDSLVSDAYHLLGVFSSEMFLKSQLDKFWKRKPSPITEIEKQCNIEITAQVSHASSGRTDGDHPIYHLEGLMESSSVDGDVKCFSPMQFNATSVNVEVYQRKAMKFSLMVTFITLVQFRLFRRQMQHRNIRTGAANVSIVMIGHQAIMDIYICFLFIMIGIVLGALVNVLVTAALIKFSLFSICEMRYLLIIWTANQILTYGEDWVPANDEALAPLYSNFYKFLFGGVLVTILFHKYFQFILLLLHSFWIPQIIINITRDLRKPLDPYFTIGMTITRVAIPLYAFGCPHNFLLIEPANSWCISLVIFMGLQASLLLIQHYFGSRVFVPSQFFPEKYNYYRRFHRGDRTLICVICMTTIHLRRYWNNCMVTPCEHFFHSHCLHRWMDRKMECPTCRRRLPPP